MNIVVVECTYNRQVNGAKFNIFDENCSCIIVTIMYVQVMIIVHVY